MTGPKAHVNDLLFGRWRSLTLYAGVEIGMFEVVHDTPKHAVEITDQLNSDREHGYRLLRALGSLELLEESSDRRFSITPAGELLREDHPENLRGLVLLEAGPTHRAVWEHLPDIVREGKTDGFQREFGYSIFEHQETAPEYAGVFNEGMTGHSTMESPMVACLLDHVEYSNFGYVCNVGGGHGHLLCTLLQDTLSVEGSVLEQPVVADAEDHHWYEPMGVSDRVDFVAGDFFEAVPTADAYLMKHILHDWNDEECVKILSTIRAAAPNDARLFNCELVVPGSDEPHFAKVFDVNMMVMTEGRERTEDEYADLFEAADFEHVETHQTDGIPMAAVEAVPS